MSRKITGGAIASAIALTSQAYAQSTPASSPPPAVLLPPIEITAPRYQPLADGPAGFAQPTPGQTVTRIERSRFDGQPAFTIGDILIQSPGVTFTQGNGPRDIAISIRGSNERQTFGIRNVQVFDDGFPVTQPDGLGRSDLVDPHAYAGIDVVRGPSSAEYGNYATGGALNFRTRPAGDVQWADLGSDFGSFGYVNTYGTLGFSGGGADASLFTSDVRGSGFITHSRFETQTENLLASYQVSAGDRLTLKIINNNLDANLPIRLSLNQFNQNPFQRGCVGSIGPGCASVSVFNNGFAGPVQSLTADQAGLGRHDERAIVGTRWEHAFGDDTVWRTQLTLDDRDINQPTSNLSFAGPYTSINLMSDVSNRSDLFGLPVTSSVGVGFNQERITSYAYNLTPAGGATRGALTQTVFGRQLNGGGHARAEIAFSPDWKGVVAIGGQYTEIVAAENNFSYAANGIQSVSTIPATRRFYDFAPELAVLYTPTPELTLHGRAATGYGTPQATNLFTTSAGTFGANTQLQTQTNIGVDLGASWVVDKHVSLEVTGFYEFFHNELVTQSAGVNLQSFTFNAPNSEHRGIEIGLSCNPLPSSLPGLKLTASYLYDNQIYTNYTERLSGSGTTASFNRAGKSIPGVDPNFLFARIAYDQPDGPFHGFGGFAEVNVRDAYDLDNANLIKAPAYDIFNLELHYDPGIKIGPVSAIRVFFEVQNLFNQSYVASASNITDTINAAGAQNGAGVLANSTGSIFAGSPRAFFGGVKVKL